jgi:hypothetical protein
MNRLTCPNDPTHDQFYMRKIESNAFRVSAEGGIATQETRNSYDCEGAGPVHCDQCEEEAYVERENLRLDPTCPKPRKTPVEAINNQPDAEFFEDDSL